MEDVIGDVIDDVVDEPDRWFRVLLWPEKFLLDILICVDFNRFPDPDHHHEDEDVQEVSRSKEKSRSRHLSSNIATEELDWEDEGHS